MNPGDIVELTLKDRVVSGRLMPRPQLLDPNILVIKLESGYNIGIKKDSIASSKVIEAHKTEERKKSSHKKDSSKKTVAIVSVGGTISSRIDYKTGGVYADYTAADFLDMFPELKNIANIEAHAIMNKMSEDITLNDWQKIAKELVPIINSDVEGVVVTHGTDTLHFTTAAMSFLLNVQKPVIFTAAQRSIDRGSSDAFENLFCAVKAAIEFDGAVVATCMHESSSDGSCLLIRGTKVRKMHTSRRDAFRPINEKPLARITMDSLEVLQHNYPKQGNDQCAVTGSFANVGLLHVYPGIKPEQISFFEKYDGLVIAATALGHVPNTLYDAIEALINKGVFVTIVSQTLYGKTHPFVYSNLRELSVKRGVLFGGDMLPETAYVKLSWVLSQTKDRKEAGAMFIKNIAGELQEEIDEGSFLN